RSIRAAQWPQSEAPAPREVQTAARVAPGPSAASGCRRRPAADDRAGVRAPAIISGVPVAAAATRRALKWQASKLGILLNGARAQVQSGQSWKWWGVSRVGFSLTGPRRRTPHQPCGLAPLGRAWPGLVGTQRQPQGRIPGLERVSMGRQNAEGFRSRGVRWF